MNFLNDEQDDTPINPFTIFIELQTMRYYSESHVEATEGKS